MQGSRQGEAGHGVCDMLVPGIRRVLAANPSAMTGRGTNSYLIGTGAVALIDPGPDDPAHLAALLAALRPGESISHILVTHAHRDHSGLAPALARATGAPVLAFGDARAGRSPLMEMLAESHRAPRGEGVDAAFRPDILLADGDTVGGGDWELGVLHTPGHFGNHLCFDWAGQVFCGDHVMGWSSSVIAPPDGDMRAYMASLGRLAATRPVRLFPGHGEAVTDPAGRIAELTAHRRARAEAIAAALQRGPATATELARQIYHDTPAALLGAAALNVFAHLIDMTERNTAMPLGPIGFQARFAAS